VFDDNANKSNWDAVNDASIAYNLTVGFKNSGPNNLGAGESVEFTLTGTDLDVTDFLSGTGDVQAMIHVLSLPEGGSVKLGGEAVPEPASMAALGLGAVAMLRRRKKA
ncbi:PEP-CTERM sorting domain-containing protein, partial [bacterium]